MARKKTVTVDAVAKYKLKGLSRSEMAEKFGVEPDYMNNFLYGYWKEDVEAAMKKLKAANHSADEADETDEEEEEETGGDDDENEGAAEPREVTIRKILTADFLPAQTRIDLALQQLSV